MRIGLISDTHDLLRAEARQALAGVDRILHAGDICTQAVLDELGRIAPVTAVRGNNDRGAWAHALPETEQLTVAGVRILVVHDLATLGIDPAAERVDVVVSGHSHRPSVRKDGHVLYVNPGSAGPRRFRLPVSVGFLDIEENRVNAQLQELPIDPRARSRLTAAAGAAPPAIAATGATRRAQPFGAAPARPRRERPRRSPSRAPS